MLTLLNGFSLPSLITGLVTASTLSLGMLISPTLSNLSANAFDLGNGQTTFLKSPRLIRAASTQTSRSTPSTYQFTIAVPENAGEALQAVTISQKTSPEQIDFEVSDSEAFIGDSFAGGPLVSLSSIGGEKAPDTNEVTIVFDEPIQPGNTVTVSLEANHNPTVGGVYQFGVTAYPVGESSPGLYLGSARLHFMHN